MIEILSVALSSLSIPPILGAVAAIVQIWLIGRLVIGAWAPALITAGAGWGAAALLMTVLGTWGDGSLAALQPIIWVACAISLGREIRRRQWPSAWRAMVVMIPIALLISGRVASEWDEFSHWLHAFRYLDLHETLPGRGRPAMESCCAAYPYGWPLLNMIAAKASGYSEAIPGLLNLFILALCGDLLAHSMAGGEERRPGWAQQAWAGLLVTALGTTFVPKLVFTAYADVATSSMVLAGAWLVWRRPSLPPLATGWALGLCAAALVAQKPANLILAVLIFACAAVMMLNGRHLPKAKDMGGLALAIVPMAAIWLVWRHFVAANLVGEELVIQPLAKWNWDSLAAILAGMAEVAANKGGYFGIMVVTVAACAISFIRPIPQARLIRLTALMFLGYNAFLYFTYLAVFLRMDAERVASFWRYNTHLGLLTALLLAVMLPVAARRFPRLSWAMGKTLPALALVVIVPLLGIRHIRFDHDPMKTFLRETHRQVKAGGYGKVALLDPRGSGLSQVMARFEWNGDPVLSAYTTGFHDYTPERYRQEVQGADHMLVVSWTQAVLTAFPTLSPGPRAVLMRLADQQVIAEFPYPGQAEPKVYP